ncbi:MAG: DUF3363 domain-containing protein [Sphingomonadaceae bacterium]|nr:DUF3363 domain-containing protein [Sphingomonadaceae bacterium]
MFDENQFQPKLGRSRGVNDRRSYHAMVVASAARTGTNVFSHASRPFRGLRIGRGGGVARLLSHGRGSRVGRHVYLRVRIVRLRGKALMAAHAHLRYLQRGNARVTEPVAAYSGSDERADVTQFEKRFGNDRHQFRILLAPEDGDQYDALRPLVRRLMQVAAADLGTKLDWVAVDHHDNGRPHSHIVLAGRDDQGQDLVISPDYLFSGLRERAAAIVSLDLGPRMPFDREVALRREAQMARFTEIDRELLASAGADRLVIAEHGSSEKHVLRLIRLKTLEQMQLSEQIDNGRWRLSDQLRSQLEAVGERLDLVREVRATLAAKNLERAPAEIIFHCQAPRSDLVGEVVLDPSTMPGTRHTGVLIDALGGRTHWLPMHRPLAGESIEAGMVVRLSPLARRATADLNLGQENGPPPGLASAITILSRMSLAQQIRADEPTWLDEQLGPSTEPGRRGVGFGGQLARALVQRIDWLSEVGLIEGQNGEHVLPHELISRLRQRAWDRAVDALSNELSLPFSSGQDAEQPEQRLFRRMTLSGQSYAVVGMDKSFTLVPGNARHEQLLSRKAILDAEHGIQPADLQVSRGLGLG